MPVHFAYVDESGSAGMNASLTFTLSCLLVAVEKWPQIFDEVLEYRRFLKAQFGVPVRAEIKANYLLQNHGAFRKLKLGESARFAIYRGLMRLQAKLELQVFTVVVRKDVMLKLGLKENPRTLAWGFLLQRLERFTTKSGGHVLLVHDEGDGDFIRKATRKTRRIGSAGSAFGTGSLKRPARLIVEDPVARQSHQSYFIQLADLDAYAAFRRLYPPPAKPVQIVPQTMWDELGGAIFTPVNQVKGGAPGIVAWP